jgi:hypothetical protein
VPYSNYPFFKIPKLLKLYYFFISIFPQLPSFTFFFLDNFHLSFLLFFILNPNIFS